MKRRVSGRAAAGSAAALAVAGLLAAGCSSSTPGSSSGGGSGSGGAQASSPPAASSGSGQGSGGSTAVGSLLFPIAVGERWVYADHLGALGSSTTVNTVKSVKPVSGGNLVTLTNAAHIAGVPSKPTTITYMFYSDGSIGVPFTQLSGGKVTIRSGSIVWPPASAIASGQSHTSTLLVSVNSGGRVLNEKVHVTVKGGGTQTVTVPAGTYHTTIVEQTMAESFAGHRVTIEVRTWLAPNVGPVKSEVAGIGGTAAAGTGPLVVEDLKSFTK
jgi:hypothetical protein